MQDDQGTFPPDDECDNDSLFGSPPPSPGRGGPSSPLALPSGLTSVQNVGTLALPGSHHFDHLPSVFSPAPALANQAAQPQSHPHQRPQSTPSRVPGNALRQHAQGEPTPSLGQSRSTTRAVAPRPPRASGKSTKKPAHRSGTSPHSSSPRPTPPPIALPDPSDPPPSNFLRNQQSLLGLAGMVSGVNPANLALPRGSSPNNPIVLDEENEFPTIGRRPPQPPTSDDRLAPISPANLPLPPRDEIIQTLVKQKNIFPVVAALLSLVARTSEGQTMWSQYQNPPTTFHRPYINSSDVPHPPKRRKVNSVPAGAADWDVPYPFAAGEGPANYRADWERQRGKHLIEDLVGLVKSAARKAATKNLHRTQQQQSSPPLVADVEAIKISRHYRPERLKYGREPGEVTLVTPAASQALSQTGVPTATPPDTGSSAASCTVGLPHIPTAPPADGALSIDQLFSDLMASPFSLPFLSAPLQNSSGTSSATPLAPLLHPHNIELPPSTHDTPHDTTPALQPSIDDFLAMIDNLPPEQFSSEFFALQENPLPNTSSANTPTSGMDSRSPALPAPGVGSNPGPTLNVLPGIDPSIYDNDPSLALIDPALLSLSFPATGSVSSQEQTRRSASTGLPPTPTLICSPLSLDHDEYGPGTPSWDCAFPEPEVVNDERDVDMEGGPHVNARENIEDFERDGGRLRRQELSLGGPSQRKGKEREFDLSMSAGEVMDVVLGPNVGEVSITTADGTSSGTQFTSSTPPGHTRADAAVMSANVGASVPALMPIPPTILPFPLSIAIPILEASQAKQVSQAQQKKKKEEILKRARAMREQLVAEVERAKVELWETTMEGGCLVVLGKEIGKETMQKGQ